MKTGTQKRITFAFPWRFNKCLMRNTRILFDLPSNADGWHGHVVLLRSIAPCISIGAAEEFQFGRLPDEEPNCGD